jgi:hypothetical protein
LSARSESSDSEWYMNRIKFYKNSYLEEREKNKKYKKYKKMAKKLKKQLENVSMERIEGTLKTIMENTAVIREDVRNVRS